MHAYAQPPHPMESQESFVGQVHDYSPVREFYHTPTNKRSVKAYDKVSSVSVMKIDPIRGKFLMLFINVLESRHVPP